MKIELQNYSFYPATGGIENYLYNFSKSSINQSHEPKILCCKHLPYLINSESYDEISVKRHPNYVPPSPFGITSPFYFSKKLQKFLKKEKKESSDLIICRHPYYAYASSKISESPVVYIMASVWPLFLRKTKKEKGILKVIDFNFRNFQEYLIEKTAVNNSDKIIALSNIRMKEIKDHYDFSGNKSKVIYPGIDLNKFSPVKKDLRLLKELKISSDSKIILTVCRLSKEKNTEMLIKAFSCINHINSHLVVVGDGPERFELEKLAKKLKIEDKIKFTGFRKDIERFYSLADIFVLLSKYEGFGHVYLEALASGIPCIALKSDYPNIIVASDEIILNKKIGYLIKPNIEELCSRIDKLLNEDDLRIKMSLKARKMCEKRYSWDKHVENVLKFSFK